jgi:hypothetical protein
MPEILRVKVNWTGFVGAPGYTNLYFSEFVTTGYTQAMADGAVAKASTFMTNIKAFLPSVVTVGVDPTVEIIQADTGNLVGFFSTTPPAPAPGAIVGPYSAASGACFSWGTNGVRNGRRVRGRTFIVPIAGSFYDNAGTINDTNLTALRQHGTTLLATGGVTDFGVWSRPSSKGATDGAWFAAETSTVKDKVAILRSRRD